MDIKITGAFEHNLKGVDVSIERGSITVITGMSGSGKSSLAFDTVLAESQRRFFYTLSNYSRQFLDLGTRPAVRSVTGLSPSIALAQNETMPSRKATVGTLTDISELLGVCFARFGKRTCPEHGFVTDTQNIQEFVSRLLQSYDGKNLSVWIPIAEKKKGNFATRLTRLALRGYAKAYIDGRLFPMTDLPDLVKAEKHTIKVLVDIVKMSEKNRSRLIDSLTRATEEGDGYAEFTTAKSPQEFDWDNLANFANKEGCPSCGFAWPALDSRYFSANSLGKCETCEGYGAVNAFEDDEYVYEVEYQDVEDLGALDSEDLRCPDCQGTGLRADIRAISLGALTPHNAQTESVDQLFNAFDAFTRQANLQENPAFQRVAQQIQSNLQRIRQVGLGYLQLARRVRSLSGGELQRLKLAGILGDQLRGVLYVLDEPSQGLHPREIEELFTSLSDLKKQGNTLIIVDHDETMMRKADWIIDLGPGGGARGGQLMAKFKPQQARQFASQSLTAKHLSSKSPFTIAHAPRPNAGSLHIIRPSLHNLRLERAEFKKQCLNVVTGISGAGKSSLSLGVLYENARSYVDKKAKKQNFKFRFCENIQGIEDFEQVALIDRKPVAKSSVSMPATYLDVFGILRDLYGQLPEAQMAGLDAASFSLMRAGGRCEHCSGRGEVNLKMRFLADARMRCDVCQGARYRPHVLAVKFQGLSLSDVLNLTIDEAVAHFASFKKIQRLLQPAVDLGLGYLKMGQPSASLSGGEAQRLKLVPFLVKKYSEKSLIILDEPTTGLHFTDIERLLRCVETLVASKATIVMVEHNMDVLRHADWVLELGPGSADKGGELVSCGPP